MEVAALRVTAEIVALVMKAAVAHAAVTAEVMVREVGLVRAVKWVIAGTVPGPASRGHTPGAGRKACRCS